MLSCTLKGEVFCDILIPHSSSLYHLRRVWEGRVGDCAWVCLVVHLLQKFGNDDDDGDGEDGDGHDDEERMVLTMRITFIRLELIEKSEAVIFEGRGL